MLERVVASISLKMELTREDKIKVFVNNLFQFLVTIMLCYRLGHPSFHYLKRVYPSLFKKKNLSSFQCDICELAKHHHLVFPPKTLSSIKTVYINSQ